MKKKRRNIRRRKNNSFRKFKFSGISSSAEQSGVNVSRKPSDRVQRYVDDHHRISPRLVIRGVITEVPSATEVWVCAGASIHTVWSLQARGLAGPSQTVVSVRIAKEKQQQRGKIKIAPFTRRNVFQLNKDCHWNVMRVNTSEIRGAEKSKKPNLIELLPIFHADAIVNKISNGGLKTNSVDLDDDDEDSDQETAQDLEGSADQPLDF